MTIHEIRTDLSPAEVIERARTFFALAGTPSAAFPEQRGAGFLKLHVEVGEIVIAALPEDDHTRVRGSASRGAQLLMRFLTTLGHPLDARQTVNRYRDRQVFGARTTQLTTDPAHLCRDGLGSCRRSAPRAA
jgi:hypothetical protein